MSILKGFRLIRIFRLILVSLFLLTTLHLNGYCDDWVYVYSDENLTEYYNSSSVKIDTQKKIIKVWTKRVFTEKGKIDFINKYISIDKHKYNDWSYNKILYLIDYKEWKFSLNQLIEYSKSGSVINNDEIAIYWRYIVPDSVNDVMFNKILEDYKIQR